MKRSKKSRFVFLRWAASIAIAWPVLSGTLCPPDYKSGWLIHDGAGLHFVPRGSCFPRKPTVIELLQSRHRAVVVEPFRQYQFPDPFPAWTRQPDGRTVL